MKKIIRITLFVIAAATTVVFIAHSAGHTTENKEELQPRKVETVVVTPTKYRQVIFGAGKLSDKEESKLSFKTGGIIKRIYVSEGQSVRKGQVLAELALDEIQAQAQQAGLGRQQAEISIENAKLALKLAERDYQNAQGLYRDSVATLEQLQNAEVQLENARNQLQAAQKGLAFNEQNVEVAQFNLRFSKITAPAEGIILRKMVETNELVGPGAPVFIFGSREKAQVIKVNITDKDIIHVQIGDSARVAFDAYPDHYFQGIVREAAGMADAYTNTYEVEIEIAPEGKRLLSGFIGAVDILTDTQEDVFRLTVDALLSANDRQGTIFLLKDGRAHKTNVGIFQMDGADLLVKDGLKAGDEVITSGVGYLEDGQAVVNGELKIENGKLKMEN
jgi:RND family efflux transporter MFP subunit